MAYEAHEHIYSEEEQRHREESFYEEDKRWTVSWQLRDWLLLLFFMVVTNAWCWIVWFYEPGLR